MSLSTFSHETGSRRARHSPRYATTLDPTEARPPMLCDLAGHRVPAAISASASRSWCQSDWRYRVSRCRRLSYSHVPARGGRGRHALHEVELLRSKMELL